MAADTARERTSPRRISAEIIGRRRQLGRVPRLQTIAKTVVDLAQPSTSRFCNDAVLECQGWTEGKALETLGEGWDAGIVARLEGESGAIGFIFLSRRTLYELCDRSLGGKRAPTEAQLSKPPTAVEAELGRHLSASLREALAGAFHEVVPDFITQVSYVGPFLLFSASDMAQVPVFVLWLDVDFGFGPQRAAIALLQTAIAPISDLLKEAAPPQSTKPAKIESPWAKEVGREVSRTNVQVTAVLEKRQMTLAEIADLRIGDVIKLNATARSLVDVEGAGATLFRCELGKNGGVLVLSVHSPTGREKELLEPAS